MSNRSPIRFSRLGILLLPIVGWPIDGALAEPAVTAVRESAHARAIAFGHVLMDAEGVRVVAVPVAINDCWDTVSSCPDVDLFIAYTTGDLLDEPVVYRLPPAKGWKVTGWKDQQSFDVETVLPDANIDSNERSGWSPSVYRVSIGSQGLTINRR